MTKSISWLLKSDTGEGFAVFVHRGHECNICVLPYSSYAHAMIIVKAYEKVGYEYIGQRFEVDNK